MSKRQPTATAGKRLGRYRIERELGRGGMGVVYLAVDENLARTVALKTTSVAGLGSGQDARSQRRARFIREVKALAQVNHENVVHVFDAGEADDGDLGWVLFYTMEHVDGVTLAQLVHKLGALSPGAAAAVCMQVGAGLGAAHLQGIVHRDVKPANIFLTNDSRALIGDFGICKIEGSTQITRRDQLVGTPNYLAPEQILGEEISPATDVFALGALFFVIATNSPLRDKTDAASLLKEAGTNDPAKKVLADQRFPDGLRKVVARALDRDPKKRFKDGLAFADALADHATRIPALDGAAPSPTTKVPGQPSLDGGTSPFARLPAANDTPPPDTIPPRDGLSVDEKGAERGDFAASGAGGIEEVAKALLQGFGDEKPSDDANAQKKPLLPVARTESTVMFNIRQLEDAEPPKTKVRADLPVALTEPSGPMDRPGSKANAGVPDDDTADPVLADRTSDGDDDDADGFDADESTFVGPKDEQTPDAGALALAAGDTDAIARPIAPPRAPREPVVGPALAQLATTARDLSRAGLARARALPPAAMLAVVVVGGVFVALALLFVVAAATGRFSDDAPAPTTSASAAVVDEPAPDATQPSVEKPTDSAPALPAACAARPRNDRDRDQAKKLYASAIDAFQTFKKPEALVLVDKALAKDPRLAEAHFIRARILAEEKDRLEDSRVAYECVIALAPLSADADAARKAIGK